MPAAGISLGDDAIRLINLKPRAGTLALADFAEEKLSLGAIAGGEPARKDEIISILKKLKHDYRLSFVNVSLPEDKAYVFRAEIALPRGANIADSVGFILEENIPLPPAEAVFDFSIVSRDEAADTADVVVSALPQETVESYLEIFRAAGLVVLQFDIASDAVVRAVVSHDDKKTRLVAHFVGDKVVLAVVSHALVQFVSVLNPAAETSASALLLREREKLSESVELVALRDEIKKVFSYWQAEQAGKEEGLQVKGAAQKVESIIISGDFDEKQGIAAYLSKNLGIGAAAADVWQNAFSFEKFIPEIVFEDSLRFAPAIGMALSGIREKKSEHV